MATLLRVETVGQPILEQTLARMSDLRPAYGESVAAWRDVGEEEFFTETWRRPGGSARSWERTKYPFGRQQAGPGILRRSGALLRAYMGAGAGSIESVTDRGAEFGVSGTLLPYAAVHRGGAGAVNTAAANRPAEIPVTPKMRRFLAAAFGVFLRRDKRVIVIPHRPHFTANAEVRTRVAGIFAAHLAGRPIPSKGRVA